MTPVGDVLHHWAPYFVSYGRAMLVQSSLVILLLLAADVLLRHRVRPAIRYAIWMLALAKLLLPPALASPTSPAFWLSEQLRAVAVPSDPVTGDATGPVTGAADPVTVVAAPFAGRSVVLVRRVGGAYPLPQPGHGVSVPIVLLTVWMGGVLVLVARIVRAGRAVRRLIAMADPPPPDLLALVDDCRRQLGVKKRIDARCTALAPVPAILGFWNPVILVPAPLLASLTTAQMRAVLLHEVAHWKRWDVWVDGVQALVQVVHWYNPLVWVANSVIRQAREQAVDEVVLMHMGETPEVYPETLLQVARMTLPSRARIAGVAILERGTGLRRRITRMLEGPTPATVRVGAWNAMLIGAAALIVLPMAPRAAVIGLCESTSHSANASLFDSARYAKRKAQWLACIESRPSDVTVIESASDFMWFFEPGPARALLERARALEPANSRWSSKLALQRLNEQWRDAVFGDNLAPALEKAERALAQGTPCEGLNDLTSAPFHPFLYAKLKEQWLACIESSPKNVDIIEKAAQFVRPRDLSLARELYERARALEPDNSRWISELGLLQPRERELAALDAFDSLKPAERATRALNQFEHAWAGSSMMEFLLTGLPQMAFDAGDMIKARAYAEQLLAYGKGPDGSWAGRAVHQRNVVLGRIALREGRRSDALTFLRRSGELPGPLGLHYSPGPNMSLAKDLLEAGETAAVLAYFEQCRTFWKMGGELLDLWAADVWAGHVPNFGSLAS